MYAHPSARTCSRGEEALGGRGNEPAPEVGESAPGDRREQGVMGGEVAPGCAVRHPGAAGDLAQTEGGGALAQ